MSVHRSSIRLILLTALLGGCSWLQPEPPMSGTLLAMQSSATMTDWRISGKVGLRGTDFAESAYLNWQQCGDDYTITLSGPLGQGAARIQRANQRVVLTLDNRRLEGDSAEQLLQDEFGWALPVQELYYWSRGLPAPGSRYHINKEGNSFSQSGWQLLYPKVTTSGSYTLPTRVVAMQPDLKVTLLIGEWQTDTQCPTDTP